MKLTKLLCGVFSFFTFFILTKELKAQSVFEQLVWSDEFNYNGLPDSLRWSYDVGRGCPQNCGWGNNELQFYTQNRKENARVENGVLIIEAHKENWDNANYTSARLVTRNKGDWNYGRFEIRAKLPQGIGIWPAIWMLPTNWKYGAWPKSGEIDIMEFVGYVPDTVYGTVHTAAYNGMNGLQKVRSIQVKDLSSAFHTYSIEWNADAIVFYIDGKKYNEYKNDRTGSAAWPFDQTFHLLLNVAVGGNWGGKQGVEQKIFPQRMEIDYVRVYQ
ncbi:MAG: glycoside hydrolase family 16 protein [Bacteroidetes bacterium]|nr:glycoside hydrolase family 16 protein [Bacteroidota bacterium]